MDITALNSTFILRGKVLKWMCVCLGALAFTFAVFNLLYNNSVLLGSLELLFSSYCCYVYLYSRKSVYKAWQPLSICIFITLLVVVGCYLASIANGLFVWILALPILYYLLLGRRLGFVLSFLLIVIQCIIFAVKAEWSLYSAINLTLNMLLCYISIWAVAHVFEATRAEFSKRLESLAMLDPLTNIGNRLAMNYYFATQLYDKSKLYTLLIDLDYFKNVNDKFGHEVGDKVLVEVANRLQSLLNEGRVFRIGGEEFALFITSKNNIQAHEIAQNIRHSLASEPINIADKEITLTASIGAANYQRGQTLDETIKAADELLYQAKNNGRNQVVMLNQ